MMNINEEIINKFGNHLRLRPSGIVVSGNAVLLIKHSSLNAAGTFWSPPGGGLEFGESITSCLEREFLEETHLKITVGKFLCVYEYLQNPLHAVELFFHCHIVEGAIKLGHDPELRSDLQIIQELKFMDFDTIKSLEPDLIHPIFHRISSISQLLEPRGLV